MHHLIRTTDPDHGCRYAGSPGKSPTLLEHAVGVEADGFGADWAVYDPGDLLDDRLVRLATGSAHQRGVRGHPTQGAPAVGFADFLDIGGVQKMRIRSPHFVDCRQWRGSASLTSSTPSRCRTLIAACGNVAGPPRTRPSSTQKRDPCQGQVTTSPCSAPSSSGPPACEQTSVIA